MARTDQPCRQVRHRSRREIGAVTSEERHGKCLDRCADRTRRQAAAQAHTRFGVERRKEARGPCAGIGRFRKDAVSVKTSGRSASKLSDHAVEFVLFVPCAAISVTVASLNDRVPPPSSTSAASPVSTALAQLGLGTPRPMGQSNSPVHRRRARRRGYAPARCGCRLRNCRSAAPAHRERRGTGTARRPAAARRCRGRPRPRPAGRAASSCQQFCLLLGAVADRLDLDPVGIDRDLGARQFTQCAQPVAERRDPRVGRREIGGFDHVGDFRAVGDGLDASATSSHRHCRREPGR
jgi:hypothetical protein